jgi:hypothetical protein
MLIWCKPKPIKKNHYQLKGMVRLDLAVVRDTPDTNSKFLFQRLTFLLPGDHMELTKLSISWVLRFNIAGCVSVDCLRDFL